MSREKLQNQGRPNLCWFFSPHASTSNLHSLLSSQLISFPVPCFVCQVKMQSLELLWHYETLEQNERGEECVARAGKIIMNKGRYHDHWLCIIILNVCMIVVKLKKYLWSCIKANSELSLSFCLAFTIYLIARMYHHSLYFFILFLSSLLQFLMWPLSHTPTVHINTRINSSEATNKGHFLSNRLQTVFPFPKLNHNLTTKLTVITF